MRWTERMRKMLQSWLEIEPAPGRGLTLREPVDHAANVLRNRVWYRGDACELDQLFRQLADDPVSRARFWAAAPESENLRKAHSGLPAVMVDALAGIVRADLEKLRFDDGEAERRWREIAEENDFAALTARAVSESLLRGQIIDLGLHYIKEGEIPPYGLDNLENYYTAYVDLGDGDRSTHDIMQTCRRLPIRSGE